MLIQTLEKIYPFVLKILRGNAGLTSIKGHNSVTNLRKRTGNNPNTDLVSINAYTKFGKILSNSEAIERKRNYDGRTVGMTDNPNPV